MDDPERESLAGAISLVVVACVLIWAVAAVMGWL